MMDDARFALRQLRKNPAFAAIAVVTLGLGIGAAAAMFGLIQGVLLSPPPYADPGRVVLISPVRTDGRPYTRGATVGQWVAWKQVRTIDPPALYRWTFNFLVLPEGSQSMGGMAVTPAYFRVLGLRPFLGREFTDAELGRPTTPPSAVIIGYDLWQRTFGGDPNIIGRTLRMSRMPAPLPIVGVMPEGVRFLPDPGAASEPNYDIDAHVDFWLGVAQDESKPADGAGNVVTRLHTGASVSQAQAEVAAVSAGAMASGSVAGGYQRCRAACAGGAEPGRTPPADAALRLGCPALLHCVRERHGTAAHARTTAALGVCDALGARCGPRPPVPAGAH